MQNNGESDSEVVPDVDTITETATAADEVPQKLHPDTVSEESADVSTTEGESIKVQSGTTGLEPENDS